MDLDDDAVGARPRRRPATAADELAAPGGVARVDDHRQLGALLEHRHGDQVEGEAVGGLERPDPALAQDDRVVALLEDVLGRHQQLVDGAGEPALDAAPAARAPDLGQQRVVLHVAGADLDHVGDLEHGVEVADVDELGDDRQPALRLASASSRRPSWPRPWKA